VTPAETALMAAPRPPPPAPNQAALLAALAVLDEVLARAVHLASVAYGAQPGADPYRGLYVGGDEVVRLLASPPGSSPFADLERTAVLGAEREAAGGDEVAADALSWLCATRGLDDLDRAILLVALAPDVDLRYERLYAYLQDDVTRRRPTVDLALNLVTAGPEEKLEARARFGPDAPLVVHGLVTLVADPGQLPPLLAHVVRPDERVVSFLLGSPGLDPRLAGWCRVTRRAPALDCLAVEPETLDALARAIDRARSGRPFRLHLHGPAGHPGSDVAEMVAATLGLPLLAADVAAGLADGVEPATGARLVATEAELRGAALLVDGVDAWWAAQPWSRAVSQLIEERDGPTILCGTSAWPAGRWPEGLISLHLPVPGVPLRLQRWRAALGRRGGALPPADLDTLAARYRLTPGQIDDAVTMAVAASADDPKGPTGERVAAAARAQSGADLASLARRVEPVHRWAELVLPEDSVAQLRELCDRVAGRHVVLDEWGFGERLSLGRGVNALFAGPSGTGKTMAADIVAGELGLDLFKVDLAGVVSKYIGETEKNLDRIFRAAEGASAILFFDEADALFGRRSEVRDSHDRYANVEVSYLLQKMEEHDGVAILATNLRQNLDESFVRRLTFTVHFPFPDEADRRRIWTGIWPSAVPLGSDVDLDVLAARFKLSGGNIRNVALHAAYLAASDGETVEMPHLLRAVRREYQKLGKALDNGSLAGRPEDGGGRP
jgi:hypothetical protein